MYFQSVKIDSYEQTDRTLELYKKKQTQLRYYNLD